MKKNYLLTIYILIGIILVISLFINFVVLSDKRERISEGCHIEYRSVDLKNQKIITCKSIFYGIDTYEVSNCDKYLDPPFDNGYIDTGGFPESFKPIIVCG